MVQSGGWGAYLHLTCLFPLYFASLQCIALLKMNEKIHKISHIYSNTLKDSTMNKTITLN